MVEQTDDDDLGEFDCFGDGFGYAHTCRLGEYTCGLDAAMAVVDGKWKPLILWKLQDGPERFNALHRSLAGVSQKHRESYHEVPPRVEYSRTPVGRGVLGAAAPLSDWATRHIDLICAAKTG